MTFNHTLDNTLKACSVTTDAILSVALKIKAEVTNEPFTSYTDEEQRALLVLAITSDKGLLYNTLNFVDKSVCDNIDTLSQLVENLLKYPPTVEQIYKVLAVHRLSEIIEEA
ncbi:MAG: hypothetical protein EOM36_03210 [Bacteroidia bacterium]|nr:hypothetical protein [Bacteroidia bacterium]